MSGAAAREVVVTYDCGTTSVKAAVVDLDGHVLAHANGTYPLDRAHPGWAEQNPDLLWQAVAEAGRQALSSVGGGAVTDVSTRVVACVFVAPWKAIIPLGRDGQVLAPAITWLDDRAAQARIDLSRRLGVAAGNGVDYWSKLLWLREHRRDVWDAAHHVVGLNTYFKYRATGELVTESSDDFFHPPATAARSRFETLRTEADLPEHLFPASAPSSAVIGQVSARAAVELGVPAGTPVLNGFGDLPGITTGAGRAGEGDAHIYIGTSSWLVSVTEPREELGAAFDFTLDATRSCVAVGALQSACLALDWITAQTYRAEQQQLGATFWDYLNAEIAQVPPAMDGMLGTHWLRGEPGPIGWDMTGIFTGLSVEHDRRHMVRAVMESIAMTHRWSWQRLLAAGPAPTKPLRVVGGGASSDVWLQILADVLGRPVEAPTDPRYTGTRGAFYCALVGLDAACDYEQAAKEFDLPTRSFTPNPSAQAHYDEVFDRYVRLPDLTRTLHQNTTS